MFANRNTFVCKVAYLAGRFEERLSLIFKTLYISFKLTWSDVRKLSKSAVAAQQQHHTASLPLFPYQIYTCTYIHVLVKRTSRRSSISRSTHIFPFFTSFLISCTLNLLKIQTYIFIRQFSNITFYRICSFFLEICIFFNMQIL